ncbi:hypothetical protein FA95DRAFT_767093 [Auriscalpium vulgare]|uniref:Uncharacterized protein n=1 Tax=Auriscalpium vulgare TaxID=40419 RepID=A0ACB8RBH4_9AGAM|nr:hypothetical protein FA95DRAFT_767093 [Auriscalpium vulgare]
MGSMGQGSDSMIACMRRARTRTGAEPRMPRRIYRRVSVCLPSNAVLVASQFGSSDYRSSSSKTYLHSGSLDSVARSHPENFKNFCCCLSWSLVIFLPSFARAFEFHDSDRTLQVGPSIVLL